MATGFPLYYSSRLSLEGGFRVLFLFSLFLYHRKQVISVSQKHDGNSNSFLTRDVRCRSQRASSKRISFVFEEPLLKQKSWAVFSIDFQLGLMNPLRTELQGKLSYCFEGRIPNINTPNRRVVKILTTRGL